ncbi:unnamed protein product [Rotaria sordida]|uniref:Uncharacterized protein n=1 Tax=Rotaria sordida TaxID=392033 RepID=A0A813VA72_9BILA|nr:unnamed protein product [Rotaria sordida]CAF0842333.1 unnamed protein product [Rotaria sordida]CAF0879867.1 unnamed protein product [Rotaria sordida]CAF0886797.1 unnamed protein product [Rotaria sordida]CAF0898751.1 unnamed protein product [Rotaria sordida]
MVTVHHSSPTVHRINKRYYDTWDSRNDASNSGNDEPVRNFLYSQKGYKKQDPCANKPLWYLKYQARLGKLSPFYDCLSNHGI